MLSFIGMLVYCLYRQEDTDIEEPLASNLLDYEA